MRHRSQIDETSQADTTDATDTGVVRLTALSERAGAAAGTPGRHRAPVATTMRVPEQKQPTHDTVFHVPAPAPLVEVAQEQSLEAQPEIQPVAEPASATILHLAPEVTIPLAAQWKASHLPRTIAATLLGLAVIGTSGLGVRYAQTQSSDNLVSLVVGLAVVVILWAVLIASTPQVVSLDGSVVTVHNTGGTERFDLIDALQPVDLVGNPRTSYWAVLLHRPNGTTQVLRHNDVSAVEFDAIVRHYRNVANQRFTEREARFNLKRARPLSS